MVFTPHSAFNSVEAVDIVGGFPGFPLVTVRERNINLFRVGVTYYLGADRGIASALYVTPKTVEAHVRSIFRKLDLPSASSENRRVHAVLTFLRARAQAPQQEPRGS